mmetsp:Transcript_47607/g.103765  ORF Transcript_47607/g.103765 Transcript_47607/m.103765 type:complete len:97 (-) Transcript_47607:2060-2350(-)
MRYYWYNLQIQKAVAPHPPALQLACASASNDSAPALTPEVPVPPGIPLTIGKDCCTPIWAGATVVTPIGTACCVPVACGTVMGYDAVYAPYVAVTG